MIGGEVPRFTPTLGTTGCRAWTTCLRRGGIHQFAHAANGQGLTAGQCSYLRPGLPSAHPGLRMVFCNAQGYHYSQLHILCRRHSPRILSATCHNSGKGAPITDTAAVCRTLTLPERSQDETSHHFNVSHDGAFGCGVIVRCAVAHVTLWISEYLRGACWAQIQPSNPSPAAVAFRLWLLGVRHRLCLQPVSSPWKSGLGS